MELELCSLLPEVEDECAKAGPPASESDEGLVWLDQVARSVTIGMV